MSFLIRIDPGSLRRSSRGQVTGLLTVSLGTTVFPGEAWDDFVVVVLGWWVRAFCALVNRSTRTAEWLFMDGPFRIDLGELESGSVVVRLVRSGNQESIEGTEPVIVASIREQLESAGRSVLGACENRGWSSADIDELRAALSELTGGGTG